MGWKLPTEWCSTNLFMETLRIDNSCDLVYVLHVHGILKVPPPYKSLQNPFLRPYFPMGRPGRPWVLPKQSFRHVDKLASGKSDGSSSARKQKFNPLTWPGGPGDTTCLCEKCDGDLGFLLIWFDMWCFFATMDSYLISMLRFFRQLATSV